MKGWPWITIVLTLALALNPLGLDVLHSALTSGEALARNIWSPIVAITAMLLLVLGLVEWLVRRAQRKRRTAGSA